MGLEAHGTHPCLPEPRARWVGWCKVTEWCQRSLGLNSPSFLMFQRTTHFPSISSGPRLQFPINSFLHTSGKTVLQPHGNGLTSEHPLGLTTCLHLLNERALLPVKELWGSTKVLRELEQRWKEYLLYVPSKQKWESPGQVLCNTCELGWW